MASGEGNWPMEVAGASKGHRLIPKVRRASGPRAPGACWRPRSASAALGARARAARSRRARLAALQATPAAPRRLTDCLEVYLTGGVAANGEYGCGGELWHRYAADGSPVLGADGRPLFTAAGDWWLWLKGGAGSRQKLLLRFKAATLEGGLEALEVAAAALVRARARARPLYRCHRPLCRRGDAPRPQPRTIPLPPLPCRPLGA